jgi:hypothetical protein
MHWRFCLRCWCMVCVMNGTWRPAVHVTHLLQTAHPLRHALLPLTGALQGADAQSCTSITNRTACTSPGVGQTCCWDVGRAACTVRPANLPQSPDNTCAGALGATIYTTEVVVVVSALILQLKDLTAKHSSARSQSAAIV